jgi:hypothetical protein
VKADCNKVNDVFCAAVGKRHLVGCFFEEIIYKGLVHVVAGRCFRKIELIENNKGPQAHHEAELEEALSESPEIFLLKFLLFMLFELFQQHLFS